MDINRAEPAKLTSTSIRSCAARCWRCVGAAQNTPDTHAIDTKLFRYLWVGEPSPRAVRAPEAPGALAGAIICNPEILEY